MQFHIRSWKSRFSAIIACALLVMMVGAPVAAENHGAMDHLQIRATFTVSDPPEAPYHAHQSMLHFPPGAVAPLHYHGGPGYITILKGSVTLYEDGEPTIYHAGDSLVETTDSEYRGINHTDEDMRLMVTYLVPHGEDVTTMVDDPDHPDAPEIVAEVMAETVRDFSDPPASFELVHATVSHPAGITEEPATTSGNRLMTVVDGEIDLSIEGEPQTMAAGDSVLIEADTEYQVGNTSDARALTMSTILVPDVHSVAPATGATVDRTFALWILVMVASTLLVTGTMLRITAVRLR